MKHDDPSLHSMPRDATGYPCKCGGYAGRVDNTDEEILEEGCARDKPGNECCARAFVCRLCGKRYAGSAEAPDIGW